MKPTTATRAAAGPGASLALIVCVLQLLGWGLVVGRRAYERWWAGALSGVTNAVLGIVLVSLELALVH